MIARITSLLRADAVVIANVLGESLASLQGRRMQAALSAFGIATGITAVVLLVSIVAGVHRFPLETLGNIGGNLIQINTTPMRTTHDPRGFDLTLRTADLDALLADSEYYDGGVAENGANLPVRTLRRSTRSSSVRGLTRGGFDVLGLRTAQGRLFLGAEYENGSRVAVVGADVAQELFVQESPVGQTMVIGDWPFQIVGVLDWVGDLPAFPDRGIYVPFKAAAEAFRPNDHASSIRLRLRAPDLADAAVAETQRILDLQRRRRGETSGEFQVTSTIDRLGELTLVLTTIKLVVGLVGGIGLFVGAVGIANVLLVSVRERRVEIGVRRAVGATRRAIFAGFLVEALAMTLSGGVVGILAAWALAQIAVFIPRIPAGARPHISFETGATAVVLLTIVGLLAGVGPARRAAAVFPAEALRAE
ncbi:MAG: ABC transporter permease [Acidobacteriota bacterium]